METIVVLLILVIVVVLITLFLLFKHDIFHTKAWWHLFHKQQQPSLSPTTIDTKFFETGLQTLDFHHPHLQLLQKSIHTHIIGMDSLVNTIIINLLCGGHVLVEWFPGLAKTKTVHIFAQLLGLDFKRIQFTPDLLPSDIIGGEIYNNKSQDFDIKMGPIMSNIILADEINRATPKVQSALLEAMQEHQVTIGGISHKLPEPFFVLATQNPIEQEGTYPLPEAQIDRFLFKILVKYPNISQEKIILDTLEKESSTPITAVLSHQELIELKNNVNTIQISDEVKHYITRLTAITRQEHEYLLYGVSPRGAIGLMLASKAVAFAEWRNFVTHADVQRVALSVFRHRIALSYQAKIDGLDEDRVLLDLFAQVSLT